MKSVGVLDNGKTPQAPVHPALARRMLRDGKAAVYRKHPFTIILRQAALPGFGSDGEAVPNLETTGPLRLKIDPGSRTTGLAVVNDGRQEIVWAGELKHRGPEIKKALDKRRAIRRGRRNRKTRYRQPRFDNRRKGGCHGCGGNPAKNKSLCRPCAAKPRAERNPELAEKWLAPSLMSRVYNVETWVRRLCASFPIGAISVEVARFDTQLIENPDISGVEYQQGELAGYELREYLLEKFQRKCAYCGKKDIPLEIEHIVPRSRGGSNRISNLTISCRACNQKKGNQTADEFGHKKVQAQARMPLRDAAMMNATRYKIRDMLKGFGLPLETGTGGRTKFNRTRAGLNKSHWADAACVGESTPERWHIGDGQVQEIRSRSYARRGRRLVCLVCPVGFSGFPNPCGHKNRGPKVFCKGHSSKPKAGVRFFRYQTSDFVQVKKTKGKWAGVYRGRISVRSSGDFVFSPRDKEKQPPSFRAEDIVKLLDRDGSYEYSERELTAA